MALGIHGLPTAGGSNGPTFTATAKDVLNHGLQGEGRFFTELATATLQAHAYALEIRPARILTGLAVVRPNREVDLQIDAGALGDPTRWFTSPSVWQFKAERNPNHGKARLEQEVSKPDTCQKIQESDTYRLCVRRTRP
jgi:hypothetical protein